MPAPHHALIGLMFVVHSGRGGLIAVIAFVSMALADFLCAAYFHNANFYAQNGWPKLAASWFAAAVVWFLLPHRQEEVLGATGQAEPKPSILRDRDSLFWIPAKHWPILLFVLGIGLNFLRF